MEIVLKQNNEREITLWDSQPENEFELGCMFDCLKAANDMAVQLSHCYGKELAIFINDTEVMPDEINSVESLSDFIKEKVQ